MSNDELEVIKDAKYQLMKLSQTITSKDAEIAKLRDALEWVRDNAHIAWGNEFKKVAQSGLNKLTDNEREALGL